MTSPGVHRAIVGFVFVFTIILAMTTASAEDGSKLWLRYPPITDVALRDGYRAAARQIVIARRSPTLESAARELRDGLGAMLATHLPVVDAPSEDGAIILDVGDAAEVKGTDAEAFSIRSTKASGRRTIVISSSGDAGVLYGAFHLLRLVQTGRPIDSLDESQTPRWPRRLLNHWDNLDGSIERGYAGRSLWKWDELPGKLDPRYTEYARAMASVGLNGAVLNNVNARPQSLSADYLKKAAALADVFRPFGVRVYLSANFAAPKTLGGLAIADPLDPRVAAWWKAKADEVYALIPDFGGFVVKANSEGQPGPQDYGRTHADGANVLADAVAPHGGIVMWRAFVYDESVDPDRAKRAYIEFAALDGKFRDNVMVQVKNGPIDFQPREPFHPLFGAMKRTRVMAELQVTQEYLGHSNHLVYLAPMWKEFLDADTFARGEGSPVAGEVASIAAVANTGDDANWCGHHFAQANWYGYGRLAWDPSLAPGQIADEWLRMTFAPIDDRTRATLQTMMLSSWETLVSYSMPLGLHHLIGGDHYSPKPWNGKEPRADWTATYYHRADEGGIGFDRTSGGGAKVGGKRGGAAGQYFPPVRDRFDDVATCPETLLLWFHRVRWDHRIRSGRTVWDELCVTYDRGAREAEAMAATWQSLAGTIDPQRHREVAERLAIQAKDARVWRDRCIEYFQTFSKQPVPAEAR